MVELIFSHIPKTAGKSVIKAFRQLWGYDAVLEDYNVRVDGASDPGADVWLDEEKYRKHAESMAAQVKPETKVIAGHFPFSKYADLFPDALKVCCIREPAARLWSTYWYWKQVGPTTSPLQALVATGKLTFEKLVAHPMMRNQQVDHFLAGTLWDEWPDDGGVFVMVTEFIENSWECLLDEQLEVPSEAYVPFPRVRENVTKHKPEIDDESWQAAFMKNGKDYEAYNLWNCVWENWKP